ncbi:MAG TPA: BTAD domain-containing putative transcriptional regulator [Gemmatimonadota bacterium]|nr:BTAD domain-containing putative transcriptional regulator [Gemmatimonadota bacterium]
MDLSSQRVTRFRALGAAELKGPEGNTLQSVLARPKLLGLLTYLAAATPGGFQRRDTITGLFWAELTQERARGALRQALYHLRQFLGEGVVVTRGDEEVGLDGDRFWCDVAAFEEALERGAREESLDLYRGELVQGFYMSGAPEFERWLDGRRDELRERARLAAWDLARGAEAQGNATDATRWARQALKLAPLDEELARQVIELLGRVGDRSGAVREYEAFATRMAEELELEPAAETRALIDDLRSRGATGPDEVAGQPAGRLAGVAATAPAPTTSTAPSDSSAGVAAGPGARLLYARSFRLGLLAGAALVVGLGIVWAFSSRNDEDLLDGLRVVVAVFDNQTGDPELDPLGHMATDWVTQGLDRIEVVDVVPSATGLAPRPAASGTGLSGADGIRGLARATGAGTVVAGAYYRSGDSIQFQAQVVDALSGQLLRAVDPVGGPLTAPGAIVDSLRQRVVGTIAVLFDTRLSPPSQGSKPPSLDAYRAYLKGHSAFHRSPLELPEALGFFYQAVALDSTFLDPRFYIVFAHLTRREWQAADSNAQLLVPYRSSMNDYQRATLDWQLAAASGDRMGALRAARARGGLLDIGVVAFRANHPREAVDALTRSESLSDWYYHWLTLIEAYHVLGDYQRELDEAQRGRKVYPEHMRMLDAEVRALAALGDTVRVVERLDESLSLPLDDGLSPGQVMMSAAAELRAHGYPAASFVMAERAIEWLQSRPLEERATGQNRFDLANAYYQRERWDEARSLFEELASEAPGNGDLMGFLGVLAARRGDVEAARAISESLPGMAFDERGRDIYWQACIASLLGERDRAVSLLRESFARGRPFSVILHRDMDLEPLRDYPPFQQYMEPKG